MTLKIAELFLTLSDTYQKLADEFSGGLPDEQPETEEVREPTAKEKKAAAAKKRRETIKAKKIAEAEAEAAAGVKEAEDAEDTEEVLDELLEKAQDLTRTYLREAGAPKAKAILKKFELAKCSEAEGDGAALRGLINAFTAAIEEEELA